MCCPGVLGDAGVGRGLAGGWRGPEGGEGLGCGDGLGWVLR